MEEYWKGPYNCLVHNSLEYCVAADGVSRYYKEGGFQGDPIPREKWIKKYTYEHGGLLYYDVVHKNDLDTKFIEEVRERNKFPALQMHILDHTANMSNIKSLILREAECGFIKIWCRCQVKNIDNIIAELIYEGFTVKSTKDRENCYLIIGW